MPVTQRVECILGRQGGLKANFSAVDHFSHTVSTDVIQSNAKQPPIKKKKRIPFSKQEDHITLFLVKTQLLTLASSLTHPTHTHTPTHFKSDEDCIPRS